MLTLVKLIDVVYLVGKGGGGRGRWLWWGRGSVGGQLHQLGHLLGHHLSAIGKTKKFIENIILKHIILNTAKTGRIF